MPELRRGAVVWVRPDPAVVGSEQDGRRPAVVVSSDGYLENVTNLVLIVPATRTFKPWPNRVELTGQVGLPVTCYAMPEQVRAVARSRITKITGTTDEATMRTIDGWLRDFLALP